MQRFENQSVFVKGGAEIAIQLRCDILVIVIEIAIVLKNSDRWSIEYPAPYHNLLILLFALYRNAFARRIAQRPGMNETDVRRIAEIIRQVQVVGSIVQGITEHYRPVRIVKFGKIKNLARIRQRRIPHPDPNQTESFACWIGPHYGIPWNDVLAGNTDAFACAVKSHSMRPAFDRIALQPTKGKRKHALRT